MSLSNIKDIVEDILKKHPVKRNFLIPFYHETYQVFASSLEIQQQVMDYYTHFTSEIKATNKQKIVYILEANINIENYQLKFVDKIPELGKNKIKEEYVDFDDGRIIRKKETEMLFFSTLNTALIIGEISKNLGQVINFINNSYMEHYLNGGYVLGHAAAILWKNKGMAIAGFSGMGKSTLSLHLMNKGATFVSNDRLLLRRTNDQVHMIGVPKYPRVNPGTIINNTSLQHMLTSEKIRSLQNLAKKELWELEEKYDVYIEKIFGANRICLSANLHALVILNWKQDIKTEITVHQAEKRQDLLPAIMKKKSIFHHATENYQDEELDRNSYIDVLKHCILLEVNGTVDFARVADFCIDFLEKQTT